MPGDTYRQSYLIYEDTSRYDLWLKLLLPGILALTLVWGIALLAIGSTEAYGPLSATAFDALLFYSILPRRLQVYDDRVRIVLGRPFAVNIPFATIREVRPASASKAFAYQGLRFATSSKSVVAIVRSKGWNVVISPANREMFLTYLDQALKARPQAP